MTLRLSLLAIALAVLAASTGAGPGWAHHSFAMYDPAKLIKVNATVKAFEWTNPHAVLIVVTGPDPGQTPEEWSIELPTSPGNLTRLGWTKHSLKPGDHILLEFNPLRDGAKGGSFKRATVQAGGQVLIVNLR